MSKTGRVVGEIITHASGDLTHITFPSGPNDKAANPVAMGVFRASGVWWSDLWLPSKRTQGSTTLSMIGRTLDFPNSVQSQCTLWMDSHINAHFYRCGLVGHGQGTNNACPAARGPDAQTPSSIVKKKKKRRSSHGRSYHFFFLTLPRKSLMTYHKAWVYLRYQLTGCITEETDDRHVSISLEPGLAWVLGKVPRRLIRWTR